MGKQPKKPRIKRFLLAAIAAAGLGAGSFFGGGADMTADFNKAASDERPAVTASAPELRQDATMPANVIYYDDRVQVVDKIAGMDTPEMAQTLGPTVMKKVYSVNIVPLEQGKGQHPVIIVPLAPPESPAP